MEERICNKCMHRPVCIIFDGVFNATRGNRHLNLNGTGKQPGTFEEIFKSLAKACDMYELRESLKDRNYDIKR